MTGYDKKLLELMSTREVRIVAEIDITGMGDWYPYKIFPLKPAEKMEYQFPEAFQAYWIRFKSNLNSILSAQLIYE